MTGGVNPTGPSQNNWQVLTPEIISRPVNHPGAVKIDYPPDTFGTPKAEKKKGSFLKKALIAVGAVGLACVALVKGKAAGLFDVGMSKKLSEASSEVLQKLKNNKALGEIPEDFEEFLKFIEKNKENIEANDLEILQKAINQAEGDGFVNKYIKKPLGVAADFVDDKWQVIKAKFKRDKADTPE